MCSSLSVGPPLCVRLAKLCVPNHTYLLAVKAQCSLYTHPTPPSVVKKRCSVSLSVRTSVRLSVPPYYACSEGTIYTYKAVCVLVFPWVPPCVFVWLNCASPPTLICLQSRHCAHYKPTPPHHLLLKSYVPLVCPYVCPSVCLSVCPPLLCLQ